MTDREQTRRDAEDLREYADRSTGYIYKNEVEVLRRVAATLDALLTELDPKPESEAPRGNETCPECEAPPNTPHKRQCPWWLWATGGRA